MDEKQYYKPFPYMYPREGRLIRDKSVERDGNVVKFYMYRSTDGTQTSPYIVITCDIDAGEQYMQRISEDGIIEETKNFYNKIPQDELIYNLYNFPNYVDIQSKLWATQFGYFTINEIPNDIQTIPDYTNLWEFDEFYSSGQGANFLNKLKKYIA